MKVVVVGGGGREHAICRALATSAEVETTWALPGNPGTAAMASNEALERMTPESVAAFADAKGANLVLPGPEQIIVEGLADACEQRGIACAAPGAAAAQLEGSKAFTRELLREVGAPCPHFVVVEKGSDIEAAVSAFEKPPVVKADGLAAGKGVLLPADHDGCTEACHALLDGALGDAGNTVVLEERLEGSEVSLIYACHGTELVLLPTARDHKRIYDDDGGPNTGGMGAVSPSTDVDASLEQTVRSDIVLPVLRALERRATPMRGFLFAGLMLTGRGPQLLEFNVRLGDPETQVILPRLEEGDFARVAMASARGGLSDLTIEHTQSATCAVVLSAQGYPSTPRKGDAITFAPSVETEDRWVIHAGTSQAGDALVTAGGRVLAVVARGADLVDARKKAYDGVAGVSFDGMHHRTDIGRERTGVESA